MTFTAVLPREALLRRGVRLEYLTVGWNVVEGSVAVAAAVAAGSVALGTFMNSAAGGGRLIPARNAMPARCGSFSFGTYRGTVDRVVSSERDCERLIDRELTARFEGLFEPGFTKPRFRSRAHFVDHRRRPSSPP